jgi:hypothetical protein
MMHITQIVRPLLLAISAAAMLSAIPAAECAARKVKLKVRTEKSTAADSKSSRKRADAKSSASSAGGLSDNGVDPNSMSGALQLDSIGLEAMRDVISFAGFDKPASSRRETFHVVNGSDLHITALRLRITYSDLQGRMLHRRELTLPIDIPQGETRMADIATFDRQNTLYYHKSRPPRKGGMPFGVEISLLGVWAE